MHFPGFSAGAADFLLERKIVGIGIDTLSPDGSNVGFPVHEKILGAGMYIVENLVNLALLPANGAFVILFPQKAAHGTESSIRAAALIS
jgi:kynurenine formamidase